MKFGSKKYLFASVALFAAFVIWTLLVCLADVKAIGPEGSQVGLATLNQAFHSLTGVHMWLYVLTDWLGLVPIAVAFGFAVVGLVQWTSRKRLTAVDRSILVLGAFYVIVIAAYLLFELVAVNYRPILIDGALEASYPSSTTMLVMFVMPTAAMQICGRVKSRVLKYGAVGLIVVFVAFMVTGRMISGVHWLSDIVGGALFCASLVTAYRFVAK